MSVRQVLLSITVGRHCANIPHDSGLFDIGGTTFIYVVNGQGGGMAELKSITGDEPYTGVGNAPAPIPQPRGFWGRPRLVTLFAKYLHHSILLSGIILMALLTILEVTLAMVEVDTIVSQAPVIVPTKEDLDLQLFSFSHRSTLSAERSQIAEQVIKEPERIYDELFLSQIIVAFMEISGPHFMSTKAIKANHFNLKIKVYGLQPFDEILMRMIMESLPFDSPSRHFPINTRPNYDANANRGSFSSRLNPRTASAKTTNSFSSPSSNAPLSSGSVSLSSAVGGGFYKGKGNEMINK
ncbi:hypothetical protein DICVIV_03826 [Dictyocaulus viviparus]|uniref:Uncharacterized protein n=1 Tax=Dictyocaulus viviparus TaxID=29172 RepID=A0A0D8XZX5_DICVI|nr:hypothetical protein DICVIV_03826 [Dictyocaulus viviparus]